MASASKRYAEFSQPRHTLVAMVCRIHKKVIGQRDM